MKPLKSVLIIALIASFAACKKTDILPSADNDKYITGFTRVIGVRSTDTSSTAFMRARAEAIVLASDADTKLRAELIGYQALPGGHAMYTVKVVNLTTCQDIIRWHWEGLTIDSISPPSDVVHAKDSVTFTLWGDAKVGKIRIQSEGVGTCGNSRNLSLNITSIILPITFTNSTVKRVDDKMVVNFSTETPQDVDWFFVLWSPDGKKEHEVVKAMIMSDGVTKKYTISFLAMIFEG